MDFYLESSEGLHLPYTISSLEIMLEEGDTWDNDLFEAFFEDASNSYVIRDEIYTKVEKALSNPAKDREFRNIVERYLNRNTQILHEPGPITPLLFLNSDKKDLFDLCEVSELEVKTIVKNITSQINKDAGFLLAKNNPVFTLIWCIIRYYTIKNDEKGINVALAIYACAAYPSIFNKYFKTMEQIKVS